MARRRSLPSSARAVGVLATALGCQRLLGLEHGVPAPVDCGACSEGGTSAGEPALAGDGGGPLSESGGAFGGGSAGAGSTGSHAAGGDVGGVQAVGAGAAGGAGGRPGGGTGAGGAAGGSDKSSGGGRGGAPPCSTLNCVSPDAAHCSASCNLGGDALDCVVAPLDGDGDEHGDDQCMVPGDDCDDADGAIHPGATEVCDGLDNDCNGTRDLEDGLTLSGTDQKLEDQFGTGLVPVFSAEAGLFLLAWKTAEGLQPEPGIAYDVFDLDGMLVRGGFIPSESGEVREFALSAGGGELAILWSNAAGAHFQRISGQGELGTSTSVTSVDYVPGVALAYSSSGDWTTFWQEDGSLLARRVGANDSLGPVVDLGQSLDDAGIQAMGVSDGVLLLYQMDGRKTGMLLTPALVGKRELDFGAGSDGNPIYAHTFAARSDGFGAIGIWGARPVFEIFEQDGRRRCGPVELPEAPSSFDIAASEGGFVLVGTDAVEELDLDCRLRQYAPTSPLPSRSAPRIFPAGDGGFIATWQNDDTTPPTLGFRRFGPHFCD